MGCFSCIGSLCCRHGASVATDSGPAYPESVRGGYRDPVPEYSDVLGIPGHSCWDRCAHPEEEAKLGQEDHPHHQAFLRYLHSVHVHSWCLE